MNESTQEPARLPPESFDEGRNLPASIHSETAIQTTGSGSMARKIAPPRDITRIMQNIKIMAAMAGDDWYYRWPVKNKDNSKSWVEGPSIKCATAVARMYGNCEVACILKDGGSHHIFEATFVDLETGFMLTRPLQQRKTQNLGSRMDAARQEDIVFQIGVSKATRNVVNNALETFTDFAKNEAKKSLLEFITKNPEAAKKKILLSFAEYKIDVKRVEFIYAKKSAEWLAPDIAKMIAEVRAITDGMANKDETYPPTPEEAVEHEKAISEASVSSKPVDQSESDWDTMVSGLIAGLNNCKSSAEVSRFLDENAPSLETISKAPDGINTKWTKTFNAKMKEINPPPKNSESKKSADGKLL